MEYYTKCCSCGKRMQRRYKTCETCYENYKNGVTYVECSECGWPFKKPSKYGMCYMCYKKVLTVTYVFFYFSKK